VFDNVVALVLMEPHPLLGDIVQVMLLPAPVGRLARVAVSASEAAPANGVVDPEVVRPTTMGFTVICTVAVLVESTLEVAVARARHGEVKVDEAAAVKVTPMPDTLLRGEIAPQTAESSDHVTPAFVTSLVSIAESVVIDGSLGTLAGIELDKAEAVREITGSDTPTVNVFETLGFTLVLTLIVSVHD
jgi:hypothetical protein